MVLVHKVLSNNFCVHSLQLKLTSVCVCVLLSYSLSEFYVKTKLVAVHIIQNEV